MSNFHEVFNLNCKKLYKGILLRRYPLQKLLESKVYLRLND